MQAALSEAAVGACGDLGESTFFFCVPYLGGLLRMDVVFSCLSPGKSPVCASHINSASWPWRGHQWRQTLGGDAALALDGARSQAFSCWIIHTDSRRPWRRPSAIPHMTVWQRCTSCSMKVPLSYLPWKLRTHRATFASHHPHFPWITLTKTIRADIPLVIF